MNPQRDVTEKQTSRSLVADARVQSSTNEVGPSTGREEQRNGVASWSEWILRCGAAAKIQGGTTVWERALLFGGGRRRKQGDLPHFPLSGEPERPGPGGKGCDCDLPTDG